MTTLQIIGFIGLGIIFIGAMFLTKEWVKTGVTLVAIGGILGIIGAIWLQVELDKNIPTALDVYRGKTTLEITYRDSVAVDSVVVYKVRRYERRTFKTKKEALETNRGVSAKDACC